MRKHLVDLIEEDILDILEEKFKLNTKLFSVNGHHVIAHKINFPLTFFSLTFGVGAALEPYNLAGISHFIEHMVFKGTDRFAMGEVAKLINSLGGYLNAYTSYDHTSFYSVAPSGHLTEIADAIYDMVLKALFDPKELENEREVVLEEIRQSEDDPLSKAFKSAMERAYRGHPLGKPILGYFETVSKFSRDEVVNFWREHYNLSNSFATIVSPHDPEEVREIISQLIERYSTSTDGSSLEDYRRKLDRLTSELPQKATREISEVESNLNRAYIVGIRTGVSLRDLRDYSVQSLAVNLLSAGRSAPLKIKLKEELKLADNVSLSEFSLGDKTIIYLWGICDKGREEELISELDNLLESQEVDEYQLTKTKNLLVFNEVSSLESTEEIGSILVESFILGDLNWILRYLKEILERSARDIPRPIGKTLKPMTIVINH